MAIETFESWRPQPRTAALLAEAAAILDQAQADGFRLSLRQLYYQLVTSNAIANRQSEYKRLGEIIGRGRLAGFIDWSAIEDRGRMPRIPAAWDGPDDMDRDLFNRLTQLTYELPIQVERIALTRPQIDEHDPPPNPAKLSDSRAGGYIAEHGPESWELDALDYNLLANLVRDAIRSYRDDARWDATLEREDAERESIEEAAANVA